MVPHLRAGLHNLQLLQQLWPYNFQEKLIPLTIVNALEGRPPPVVGHGSRVRDLQMDTKSK